jgi:hypothetical protein
MRPSFLNRSFHLPLHACVVGHGIRVRFLSPSFQRYFLGPFTIRSPRNYFAMISFLRRKCEIFGVE